MIHISDHALSELLLMILLRMVSFQMIIEKLIKKMGPGTTRVTELCCFTWILFFTFFKMETAGCLYNFVQMRARPGIAVAAIDA